MTSQMTLVAERAPSEVGVYVMPSWPDGFCPAHYCTGVECTSGCWETRIRFAGVVRALAEYFERHAKT